MQPTTQTMQIWSNWIKTDCSLNSTAHLSAYFENGKHRKLIALSGSEWNTIQGQKKKTEKKKKSVINTNLH